jgi:kynurenine formamidase
LTHRSSWFAHSTARPHRPAVTRRPAHQVLLGADIPIIERLTNLRSVPDTGARLIALAAPVRAMASFPARVVAPDDAD